jgi:hypothetical protein
MAVALLLLPHQLQRLFLLDINTKVIPNLMGNQFRKLFSHLLDLISHNDAVHRMPTDGVPVPISLLRPYQRKPRRAPCFPHSPPSLLFENFLHRSSVHPVRTLSRSVSKSSSSRGTVSMSDHLDNSLHQETPIFKGYLKDMFVHHVLAIDHDVIGVHRTGTSRM